MAFGELLCHEESPPPPETRSTRTLSSPEVNFIRSQPSSSPYNLTRSLSQPKAIVTQSQGNKCIMNSVALNRGFCLYSRYQIL